MTLTEKDSHASFGFIWKIDQGILWMLAVNVIDREDEIIHPLKMPGGKADPLKSDPTKYETPLECLIREIGEEACILVRDAKEVSCISRPNFGYYGVESTHYVHFFLVGQDEYSGDIGESTDRTPAFWVSISEFYENHLGTHDKGWKACVSEEAKRNSRFFSMLKTQKYFRNYKPY